MAYNITQLDNSSCFADGKMARAHEIRRICRSAQAGVRCTLLRMRRGERAENPHRLKPVPRRPTQQAEAYVARIALVWGGEENLRCGGRGR